MSPDKNFRMEKLTKMSLATMPKGERRAEYKHAMIQGQLTEEAAKRASLRSKERSEPGQTRGAVAPD